MLKKVEWYATGILTAIFLVGCGGGGASTSSSGGGGTTTTAAATPTFTTKAVLNGSQLVTLASTTSGAQIYYTLDGTTPTTSSELYAAPFLVASNLTVNAVAVASGYTNSAAGTKTFTPSIASGTLVWDQEFTNSGTTPTQPDSTVWTYDTGAGGWGNSELENYCAWGSTSTPCDSSNPNAYIGTDNLLHIVARNPSTSTYTSARMKTEGLFSYQYGRIEAKIWIPEAQGMWPAFWALGSDITTVSWPACGELDIMEHIDGSNPSNAGYDWVQSSIHGPSLNGGTPYHPTNFSAAGWHTYGMIWSKGQVQFYIDDPTNPYETFTPSQFSGGTWPFDNGSQFVILNLAVGGSWPGSPDSTTTFPQEMQVQYVRLYTN